MPVRPARVEDLPRILEIYGYYVENTASSFEYTVPTLEEFTQRFLQITDHFPWIVWEEDGVILGYAYASLPFTRAAYQWCAEASVYVAPESRGRGVGRGLYAVLHRLLYSQGYRKVYAVITTANEESVAFHRAVGYRHTATMPDCGYKFGQWYGTVWMEMELNTWDVPPGTPCSIQQIGNKIEIPYKNSHR